MLMQNIGNESAKQSSEGAVGKMLNGYSIEVLPRTAARIGDFKPLLPAGTRVYIANIEGTDFMDMIRTAQCLRADGFDVMPHLPARLIRDAYELETILARYRDEANVCEALLIGGGASKPAGVYDNTMQLLETGLFDKYGFKRLHVAGHPEGNPEIDKDGSTRQVDAALRWKQSFSGHTDAQMAIVTQFFFDSAPVLRWAERLKDMGVTLPIHIGIAGPAKLQTMIKYALACGVGPSIKVLRRRAMDLSKLLLPYEPTDVLATLNRHLADKSDSRVEGIHFFPLGGIKPCVEWVEQQKDMHSQTCSG
jgi:methylenetetrahydrofolate reductase (NADH)